MTSPYAKAFTDEEVADFWETHAGDNPECDTCRWLLTLTYPSKREPARTAGDPRVAELRASIERAAFRKSEDEPEPGETWSPGYCGECVASNTVEAGDRADRHFPDCIVARILALPALSEASSVREPGGEGES